MDGLLLVLARLLVEAHAQVVLDVAVPAVGLVLLCVGELGEDLCRVLAHHRVEHVQSTTVRHAYHDVVHAQLGRASDQRLHAGNEALGSLQAESLGAAVLLLDEALEVVGPRQSVEYLQLGLACKHHALACLYLLAYPVALLDARVCACTRSRWCRSTSRAAGCRSRPA